MLEMITFENMDFGKIRTVIDQDDVWFVGKDLAEALGYKDTVNALRQHVDDEDRQQKQIGTRGGVQTLTIVNESGLYSLIFGSRLESARRFKRWVTAEVLPTLRKTGTYAPKKEFTSWKPERYYMANHYAAQIARSWLEDHLEPSFGTGLLASEVFDDYQVWCASVGAESLSGRQFGRVLKDFFWTATKSRKRIFGKTCWVYDGISWRENSGTGKLADMQVTAKILTDLTNRLSLALRQWEAVTESADGKKLLEDLQTR